jgi:hypothetical protein
LGSSDHRKLHFKVEWADEYNSKKWFNSSWDFDNLFFNFPSSLLAFDNSPQWEKTNAEFNLIFEKVENSKTNETILGLLIRESGQKLESLLEDDGKTIVLFKIQYQAPVKVAGEKEVKNKIIIQYGLYKTLELELQQHVRRKDEKPNKMKIQYAKEDPVLIQFISAGKLFPAPTLLTDTIDSGWSEKQE